MQEKVGRNDPCPCGSGKKYKQCCLSKKKMGLKGIKAKWISKPEKNVGENIMERTFGNAIQAAEDAEFKKKKEGEE